MAKYDFKAAKKYIQMHSELIESASLGMHEDWWWTAETVYEDGKFKVDLDEDGLDIAGISGSQWATPTLEVQFKDGSEVTKACFEGDIGGEEMKPEFFELGVLSSPCQDIREGKFLSSDDKLN
jgi:hypothetical protein